MSHGIIHAATGIRSVFSNLEIRELSDRDVLSEQPTIADLILPGTGRSSSGDFTCLLSAICANGERE
jgi:hypothetical protein